MKGAGIAYKKQRYITHTTLSYTLSALRTFSWGQTFFIGFLFGFLIVGLLLIPIITVQVLAGIISILYFVDTVFNLVLTIRSLNKPNEINIAQKELQTISEDELPVYTILCPLYKEIHVIPQFIEAIAKLDWPKEKLEVLLLLEEDDTESIEEVSRMHLPFYFRTIVVPDSLPKTKPKACNYGLSFAQGEYLVIYDAEDMPDPLQLKKAHLGFKNVPPHVVCLQAKLNYYNSRQNILTRFFTAEYSLWFDLTLTGLQSFNSTIPLGGTSNHFKTQVLRDLQGWDPFNVTEDADLGIRLFKKGFQTAIIDSTTYEEATSKIKNWIRQRSRWIKGYMQTYLVHMREWKNFYKEKGITHYIIFQLNVGGKILFLLLNPLMWLITLGYFTAYSFFGPAIQVIYRPPISYIAVISWVFGNFLFFYYYMLGCAKRSQWDLIKYIFMIPFYWAMMSTASAMALYQLILKPHYWEKTVHGFHLKQPQIPRKSPLSPQTVQPVSHLVIESSIKKFRLSNFSRFNLPVWKLNFKSFLTYSETWSFWNNFSKNFLQYLPIIYLLTFDFIVATFFASKDQAYNYLLLSFICKMTVIISQIIAYLANAFFSRRKKITDKLSNKIFTVFLFQWSAFVIIGAEGAITIPLLFGNTFSQIIPYTSFFLFGCMCSAISYVFSAHYAKKQSYSFTAVSLFLTFSYGVLFLLTQRNLQETVITFVSIGIINLMTVLFLHNNKQIVFILDNNLDSLLNLGLDVLKRSTDKRELRILIFNWRDTKHTWAGGAEVYIHELAKRWVKDGSKVSIFCGNDCKSKFNEQVEDVEIIRRGGIYTVYIFALLYYFFKLRGNYDIVIDCENGIPFFTPFFIRKPIILLVHHVHQEVFRNFLQFPFRQIASFFEGKVMPFIYRDNTVVTVSESSKKEILKLGFTKEENIEVIYNGISQISLHNTSKTRYPSFVYLGRLKQYKNIDVAIKAFAVFLKDYPLAKLSIVGVGEKCSELKRLTATLNISDSVTFLGKVTEKEKARILTRSWAMLQPSQVEGWGITVIEANLAGTLVIASRVNGLKDSVIDGKTGILVNVKDVGQFAAAMKVITKDVAFRTSLSQNAHLWAKQFDWDKSAREFYRVIAKCIDVRVDPTISDKIALALSEE